MTLRTRRAVVALAAALGTLAAAPVVGPTAAAAATRTVSGTVYWDQDDDGVHDPAEPGVVGIRVHSSAGSGTPTTVTGADGGYVLAGVPSATSGAITVETGWFRSQCSKLTCPAGPGPDNDFPTSNQYVKYPLASLTADRTTLDVGLLPDWPGSPSHPPAPVAGRVAANVVDVAARLSWVSDSCDTSLNVCSVGDTYTVSGQIHNQGTSAVTGLQAVLALPATDQFAGSSPLSAVTLTGSATSPGVTGLTVTGYDAAHNSVRLTFGGTLVPGGLVKVAARAVVVQGPGTPGCRTPTPDAACPKGEPQGAALSFAATRVDQPGDPDSFGPGCAAASDVSGCPTGIHDKQVEPDEVDAVGHNLAQSLGTTSTFDLIESADQLGGGTSVAGSRATVRVSVFNAGPTVVRKGWVSTTVFPKGGSPSVPTANAARTCAARTTTAGYPSIRCTGKAPLSPGVTSFATDITWTVPASSQAGTSVWVLTFVEATAQPGETGPTGTTPAVPADSAGTPTNNDASVSVRVAAAG